MLSTIRMAVAFVELTGNPKICKETCPSTSLLTVNATWTAVGSNPGLHSVKPSTNCLHYDNAPILGRG